MSQFTPLKVGDLIKWQGDACVVSATSEHAARVVLPNGLTDLVPNPIKSYFAEKTSSDFSGGNDQQYLNNLLACFADKREEITKPISDIEDQLMSTKSGKSEAYKLKPRGGLAAQVAASKVNGEDGAAQPKRARKPAAAKSETATKHDETPAGATDPAPAPKPKTAKPEGEKKPAKFAGITDLIAELVASGKDNDAVVAACKEKYPTCGPAWCKAVADKKRAKAKTDAAK